MAAVQWHECQAAMKSAGPLGLNRLDIDQLAERLKLPRQMVCGSAAHTLQPSEFCNVSGHPV